MPTLITPSTTLHILRSVPLDSSYTDTLDFSSVSAQTTYFLSKAKYTNVNMTPIRMQNAVRVGITADHLYDCNYIMFNNDNYESKWFYAFITDIKFINNNMSEIYYELDVWQSWWPNIHIHPSFVEREHTNDDTIGANTVPEGLEYGEYVFSSSENTGRMDDYNLIIAATVDTDGEDSFGGMKAGIYTGLTYNSFPLTNTGINQANAMLEALTEKNKSTAIVSMFMAPYYYFNSGSDSPTEYTTTISKQYSSINGYVPKNKKLFVYPYNFLYVTNLMGNSAEYRYEFFSTGSCVFTTFGDISCNPSIILYPNNYKGVANNYNEKMALDGFPQCEYNVDAYKAWLAQNGGNVAINTLSSTGSLMMGYATQGPVGLIGGVTGLLSTLNQVTVAKSQPPQSSGAQASAPQVAARIKDFYFMKATIRAEYARIIDEFFSLQGYATHRVKMPNITGRESWNYVKTKDINITGSVPFGDLVRIKQIFNDGVTFWHGDWVGDYTRSNNIVTE